MCRTRAPSSSRLRKSGLREGIGGEEIGRLPVAPHWCWFCQWNSLHADGSQLPTLVARGSSLGAPPLCGDRALVPPAPEPGRPSGDDPSRRKERLRPRAVKGELARL